MSTGSSEVRSFGEPWETQPAYQVMAQMVIPIVDVHGAVVATVEFHRDVSTPCAANRGLTALRIVACVNMLAGIPTADLLCQPPVGATVRPIGELVDAATEAMAYLIDDVNEEGRGGNAHILYLRLEKAVKALKGEQS